ncbi:helix-turn-helix transcriptional regulator [Aerococcaceae bacterium zg-ZJ1578]|uniref:helix-turn-helix domain-containing protein n=1 Tax=Aerococcaceae TaxID=186827 RepID=UPI0013BE1396|nr:MULTISPECIES: helix-turn-helix transcriptional regulator [unclassified Facklamia]MBK0347614.1 helix-turn-helix transcriptional regulator [Aerococcaceae bacterium zg-1578]MBR7926642.1 helix-turn-helix transcriptional regulator [Aerococcaceae bacterium zg-ZUI334]MBS4461595.1 helix-turn-helix transcriptional regulator [Aerococcaceae bacterium zg-B36]QQD65235.1 helix-turn-helix transcriptional regulator [Aerococcaceae bacterium zg-252]NEW63888.1 helix-turn-helix domain-containing protein [Fackl
MFPRIKDLRVLYSYKQHYVANYLALSQSAYSRIENGSSEITGSLLIKLSNLYQVSVDYLLDSTQMKNSSENSSDIV